MNKGNKPLAMAFMMMTISSCVHQGEPTDEVQTISEISASIHEESTSRSEKTNWSDGDQIAVYSWDGDQKNIAYQHQTGNKFVAMGEPIRFRSDFQGHRFSAYYPYTKNSAYPLDTRDQHSSRLLDVLYTPVVKVFGTQHEMNLEFHHLLSKVNFVISFRDGATPFNMEDVDFFVENLRHQASFNAAKDSISFTGPSKKLKINSSVQLKEGDVTFSALFIPQETSHIKFTIEASDDHKEVEFNLPKGKLEKGMSYTFHLRIEEDGLKVVSINDIQHWQDVEINSLRMSRRAN